MSTYLELDTELLRNTVSAAEQTNSQITEAVSFLNKIIIHNDWICDERDAINRNTERNKQTAQKIQNNASSFYKAIKQASVDFDSEEQGQITEINKVDDMISKILNVVPNTISGASNIASSISIVDFGNLSKSFKK